MPSDESSPINERQEEQARRLLDDVIREVSSKQPPEERVQAFYETAKDFCTLIDWLAEGKPPDLYGTLLRVLSTLFRDILDLSRPMSERDYEECDPTHQLWQKVSHTIGEATNAETTELEEWHLSLEKDDPENPDAEYIEGAARAGMLWDNLADIYRDLLGGIRRYELGTEDAKLSAVWDWRDGFESHWGDHALRALMTIYEIRFRLHHPQGRPAPLSRTSRNSVPPRRACDVILSPGSSGRRTLPRSSMR